MSLEFFGDILSVQGLSEIIFFQAPKAKILYKILNFYPKKYNLKGEILVMLPLKMSYPDWLPKYNSF